MARARSLISVTICAWRRTVLAASAGLSHRGDAVSDRGRFRCGTVIRPYDGSSGCPYPAPISGPQPGPECRPSRHQHPAPRAAEYRARPEPLPISPRPRLRSLVVVKSRSLLSWIARTCRPSQRGVCAAPQPSSSAATVTRGLAGKRENPTIPLRRPPARCLRQTRARHHSREQQTPFLPGARLRNRPAPSSPKSSPAALHSRQDNRIMQHKTRQAHRENQT